MAWEADGTKHPAKRSLVLMARRIVRCVPVPIGGLTAMNECVVLPEHVRWKPTSRQDFDASALLQLYASHTPNGVLREALDNAELTFNSLAHVGFSLSAIAVRQDGLRIVSEIRQERRRRTQPGQTPWGPRPAGAWVASDGSEQELVVVGAGPDGEGEDGEGVEHQAL
jgi:hypothetical protein